MADLRNHCLRELRGALGLSRREMAAEVGLSAGFLGQVEGGFQRLGHKGGLAILERYRGPMMEIRLTLEDLIRGERRPLPHGDNPSRPAA